jgi:hypothetical protein
MQEFVVQDRACVKLACTRNENHRREQEPTVSASRCHGFPMIGEAIGQQDMMNRTTYRGQARRNLGTSIPIVKPRRQRDRDPPGRGPLDSPLERGHKARAAHRAQIVPERRGEDAAPTVRPCPHHRLILARSTDARFAAGAVFRVVKRRG